MNFHFEKRKAWIRTSTHTVVRDVEPDFEEFRRSEDGVTATLVRIWFRSRREKSPGAYVGALQLCPLWGLSTYELRRILRRLTGLARAEGLSARSLRNELLECLRGKSPTGKCA
jgi:hypothetical protein